jgi:hypothetical protein
MKIEGDSKLIAGAFIKARGEMNATVVKDAKGNFGKYVTLAAIVEATSATLAKNGLAVMQEVSTAEGGVTVETWLIHESGATMQFTPLTLPLTQRTPQAVGSAVTYARRYALGAICGLAPDDDDDAQAAEDATKPSRPAQQGRPQDAQKAQGATTTPQRTVDAATGEITVSGVPTDAELDILGTWQTPQDAQAWAMKVEACSNEFEARTSFKKVVDAHGGKLTKENITVVYLDYLRKQNGKLAERKVAA